MNNKKDAIAYIMNLGEVQFKFFIEDAEPIGLLLFNDLLKEGLINYNNGIISLTHKGVKEYINGK